MSELKYQVGAYYFPNYHRDSRNENTYGPGWTEWELIKHATPRFPGHVQPNVPSWGYEDEADPAVMAKKIDAAADHKLHHFLFDWYWYEDKPFLNRALEEGFLPAKNNSRLKFALMWANHDWYDIMPAKRKGPYRLLYPGTVTAEVFDHIVDYVIEKYFKHPSYWKINGCPYFSLYEIATLVRGLGGTTQARAALDNFRRKTKAAGFPDLHLSAIVWGEKILPGEEAITNPNEALALLGFDSVASYVWVHHVPLRNYPANDYDWVREEAVKNWRKAREQFKLPYYPNVSMGWDSTPRTVQSDMHASVEYPFTPVITGNTPARFRRALEQAKAFLDEKPDGPRVLSLNAWNEWTEGSYLEPDTVNGMGYLEAIKEVFS